MSDSVQIRCTRCRSTFRERARLVRRYGAAVIVMAFDEANKNHAVPGYTFEMMTLDDGTTTAGQYDPAQAATNARNSSTVTALVDNAIG